MQSARRKNVQRTNIPATKFGQTQTRIQNRALGQNQTPYKNKSGINDNSNQQPSNNNNKKNDELKFRSKINSSTTNLNPNQRENKATVVAVDPESEMTFQDLKYTFLALELTTWLKIIPAEMERKSKLATIDPDEKMTKKRKFLFGLWQLFVRFRLLILIVVSIDTIWNFNEAKSMIKILRNFLTILITFSSTGLYFGYIEVTAYNMTTIVTIFNGLTESLKASSNQNQNQNQNAGTKWTTQLLKLIKSIFKRPLSVTLLIYLPFFIYSLLIIPTGVFLLDRNSPILLSSHALSLFGPGMFRTLLCIGLAMLDNLFYFFMVSEIYIACFFMLFFIIQIQKETDMSIGKLRLSDVDSRILEQVGKNLQVIKLLILLFNLTMSTIVYLTKLITLAGAIIGGFLTIKIIDSHPLFTIPFAMLFVEGNVLYTVLFDKVYRINEKVERLKEEILIKAQNTNPNFRGGGRKEEYKRICRSVQELGIQAGGFYLMERENTLIFMDFVVGQIVDLLLASH